MKKLVAALAAVAIIFWTYIMSYSDSFFLVYILCAIASVAGVIGFLRLPGSGYPGEGKGRTLSLVGISSVIFSGAVSLANYGIFWVQEGFGDFYPRHIDGPLGSATGAALTFLSGIIVFLFALSVIVYHFDDLSFRCDRDPIRTTKEISGEQKKGIRKVFLVASSASAAFPMLFLYLIGRPGIITPDTVWQLVMIEGGEYSRHHPYYHTRIVGFFVWLAKTAGLDKNTGILMYTTCQIILLALIVGYAAMTLYEIGVSKKWIVVTVLIYALNPYFILSAAGVQKDFIHSGCILVFLISMYRYLSEIGVKRIYNYILIVLSAVGIAVFRNNGWAILAASVVIFAIMLRGSIKRLYPAFIVVLFVTYILNHQVLDALGVTKTNLAEPFSVPLQQMARVAATGRDLSEDDLHDLNLYMQVNTVKDHYLPYLSDPIKEMVVVSNLDGHYGDFLKLWVRLGLKYPMDYVKAYSDLTRGYYNGGYDHLWKWERGVNSNSLGYSQGWSSSAAVSIWDAYTRLFDGYSPLRLIRCVGLYVWMLYILWLILVLKKDKNKAIITVPLLLLVGTILCSTPLCYQIRYVHGVVYSIFTLYPMLLAKKKTV